MQMERDILRTNEFIQRLAKETIEWVKSVQTLTAALRVWAEGFGRVIGLGPDVTSEAFDAFMLVVEKQLATLCIDLEALVQEQLLPQLRMLLDTIKRPALLIETLHALEPHHHALLQHNPAKGRPPSSLNEASIAYIALRAQLVMELPVYLSLLHGGVHLCVARLAKWQARLWRDVRTRWSDLWDALRVEGEMNAGSEETERVWRIRWEEAARDLQGLNIIHLDRLNPRSKQTRNGVGTSPPSPSSARVGSINGTTGSLEPARSAPADASSFANSPAPAPRKRSFNSGANVHRLARRPSTESMHSIRSAKSSSGHGHYGDAPEATSPPAPARHAMSRRQSMPMSLRHASSQGRLVDSFGREVQEKDREESRARGSAASANGGTKQTIVESFLPSLQRRSGPRRARPSDAHHHPPSHRHHHAARPPMPPAPQLTVSSRWYSAQALYTCQVVHQCEPPEGIEYYGLPFFQVVYGGRV